MIAKIETPKVPIRDLLLIAETGHIVTCGENGKILVWNYVTKKIVKVKRP